ncbi:MAG: putative Ig domain-containing protein, partial [Pseudomonadota bacterium]
QSGAQPFIAIGASGTLDNSQYGRVYITTGASLSGQTSLELNSTNVLEIIIGDGSTGDLFGRALTVANLNEAVGSGNLDDLIVASDDAIYVIYDVLSQGTTGTVELSDFTKVTKITNGDGTGFGNGLVVTNFDGDNFNDLITGSPLGNELIDSYGLPNGSGGIVSVLWGTDDGLADTIDIADIDQHGFNLLGQAAFTPSDTSVELDPSSGGIDDDGETPLAGTDLVDFVGNAITAVDLDGDGQDELVIGAPLATLADPDGSYTLDGISKGRVYVLYGGDKANTDWRNLSGDYELYSLYDANAGDGLILEGTETGGLAGWSVANAGQFRGNGDVVDSVAFKDLLIGAPGANANAGQAYVVFGSEINFTELDGNVFEIEAIVDPGEEGVLPIFTFQGIDDTLTLDNTSNDGAVGFAVAGLGDITAKEFGTAGGTDIGIGAPFVDVDGKGQTYIATGAPYIQPGNGIAVEDLRSDNGFVVQTAGSPAAIGDFNGDGFADFALEQNSVVFGAPIVTSEDFQRELALGALPVGYPLVQDRLEWTGYGFEPEDLTPEQRDALTLLLQTLVDSGLEGLSEQEVFDALSNGAEIEDLLEALSIDFVDEDGNIDLVGLIGDLQFMLGYSISIDFSGKDVDGDGFIRQWSDSTDPARNELTSWLLTVYDPDGAVYARATLAQQKAIGLNFNYDIAKEQVVTGVRDFTVLDPATTFNLAGVSARDQTIYAFFTAPVFESPGAPRYPLQVFAETNQEVTELEGTFSGGLRTAESGQSTAILRSQNAQRGDGAIYGGDFNGDGIDDFVEIEVLQLPRMGSNLEFLRVGYAPVTFGYNAFSYTGSASPEGTVEDPIAGKIPLALITGTATGDVDGDGYTDLLVTGYSSFMVNPIAAASDNTFAVIAFKGGQGAFDFSNPEVLHEVPIDAGTVPGALTTLDVNQDGKDELIALSTVIYPYANNGTLSGLNLLVIEDGSYDDPTVIELTEDITGIAANLIQDVNAVNHGDLNGDGITDLVFGIQYATTPGGREVSSAEFIVYGTGELDFTVGSGSSPQITAIRYESSKFNSSPYADLQETQYAPRSTAIGDFNGDGIDDLLVTNNRPDANSYVIYGAPDLPSGAAASALANSPGLLLTDTGTIRNTVTGQAYDGGYRAIKGLEFLSQAYAPLAAGDVNGDGLMDIALVDGTNGLTTVVFGERPESEQTLGVTYLEGSEDADVLIQKTTKPTNIVHVVASSEDDFIQTISDEQVLIFAGQGDDQIGLSSTDSGDIIAIDGGLGHDTLFFNPEIGTSNNLDLTKANIKGIEVIDLNTGNRLTLNAFAVKNLSETSNTLIVKGENSIVVTKGLTADTEWQQVGEGTYDGEIYDIHQFTYLDGPDTNIRVWTQRDGIALSATLIGIGTPIPNQSIKETELFGYTVPDETFVSEDGDHFELSATLQDGSPLPDWLDFDPETGRFSGAPGSDDKGDYDITVTATTEAGDTIDDTFQLQVFDENTIIGTPERDRLWGDREDNLIFGKEGDDFIWGRRGDDLLNGDEGNDYLNGGFGDDTLRGGLGADTHKGGWGADTYIGTAEEFGGSDDGSRLDKIIGLGKRDEIIFDSFDFDLEVVNTGWGRAEVRFDSDGDGSLESTLLIQGFFGRNADFNVERAVGDTIVTLDDSPFGGFFTDLFDGLSERWDFF